MKRKKDDDPPSPKAKHKNTRTTLKAVKEDASAPGPSNVVINEKPFMPTVKLGRILSFIELPTLKAANLTSFLLAASTRLQNYQRIHNYYCQDKWSQKLKLKTYINKRKGTQAIVKRLFDNSKKYGTSSTVVAKNQNLSKIKHVSLPPAELPSSSQRKRIMAF
ncbi:hypothetical protein AB4K20DRAFT_1960990 [Rhizopus microsporus]